MISSPWQVYVQKVGIFGAQTINAFDAAYYHANHDSLERSVNLVLKGFTHRHTHFIMHIFFSLYCNSFAYIEEKWWKLYVHPNWKHLSTLDSKPFCLGRLPPWYMSHRANRTSSIPFVDIYVVCFPKLHGMFCHLLRNMSVKTYRVNRA